MTVAIGQNAERTRRGNLSSVVIKRPIGLPSLLQRCGWQAKNVGTIVGILLLLLASLVVVRLHSFYQSGFRRSHRNHSTGNPQTSSANARETNSQVNSVHD